MGGSTQADGPETKGPFSPRGVPVREEMRRHRGENPASPTAEPETPAPGRRERYLLPFCGFGVTLPPNLEPNRVRGLPILF